MNPLDVFEIFFRRMKRAKRLAAEKARTSGPTRAPTDPWPFTGHRTLREVMRDERSEAT